MASRRGSSSCALCEGSNLPSCCAVCVNARLIEYHTRLRMMRSLRDSLHSRIAARHEAKSKTDEQRIWRASKAHDIMELRDRLTELKRKTAIDKTKVEQASSDLKAKTASLNLAFVTLKKRRADAVAMHTNAMKIAQMNLMATTSDCMKMQSKSVKQLCRLFPMRRVIKEGEKKDDYSGPYDSICGARLPRGLDPHSIPSEELSASLGYMLHFINIAVRILSAPSLHVSGFKGSCSNIWQRSSYWSTRQSQSKVYPLFIPRKNVCTGGEETSLTESGSSNFGVDSVDSVKKPSFDSKRSNSFSFSGASSNSMERHQYLQRGISLLKTSVTAITTYYYNSLGLDVPSNLSTFEAFAKLLHMLSSSKALRTAFESNIASRSEKQAQQLNRSIWKASSAISSDSSFMDSMHTAIMHSGQPPPELKRELLVHR
ncbi:uncharacterized protein [Miscanthus floridulus]|uniref:uncharacterized protein isoform X2 n=1 Tax=Miscanthus floridulus TaxID=154761 RepID=UPI0034599D22